MAIEIRTPTDADVAELFLVDGRNFGIYYTPEMIAQRLPTLDFERFRIAIDKRCIVGIAGSFGFDMTIPGGTTLPIGGLTWVSVSMTHRRQGLLRQLMASCHDDIVERGEPLAALGASEGTIYERFGYGISSYSRTVTIDRDRAALRPEFVAAPGSARFADDDEARTIIPALWDRFRRSRPAEIARAAPWWDMLFSMGSQGRGDLTPAQYLVHADGYLTFRRADDWKDGFAANRVEVGDFVATTHEATCALWTALLGLDLVGPIKVHELPLDSPLPYLLQNPRSVQTSRLSDAVWTKVLDPEICFGARTYGTTDRLVIESDGQRFAIESGDDGVSCRKVRSKPDLVVDATGMGPLLMGGVRASVLATGRKLTARSTSVLRRADNFFLGDVLPHCQTMF
jgi:predicted acetyltransferase